MASALTMIETNSELDLISNLSISIVCVDDALDAVSYTHLRLPTTPYV